MKTSFLRQCSTVAIIGFILYLISIPYTNNHLLFPASDFFYPFLKSTPDNTTTEPPTDLSHIVFALLGSEQAWHTRKAYVEAWWRPNVTRGTLFLDNPPTGDLLPWSPASPPYRVSDDITALVNKTDPRAQRMVHGIMEMVRELGDDDGDVRWLIMGDDDSIFFVDNLVEVLRKYDYRRYHYLGGNSEFLLANHWFSFSQAYGGGGIMMSYVLAKALARDMESCLKRYAVLDSADNTTKNCIADIGADLTPQLGTHQIDLCGDISGFLSSHPLSPLVSLHHFDKVDPIFPSKDSYDSTRHLMAAAAADQSRMLQQTICHDRQKNWSISISFGYSAQIYEAIFPRSFLQIPIETFTPWMKSPWPPYFNFNTRQRTTDPCESPHNFFLQLVEKQAEVTTTYARAWPRDLPPCASHSAHAIDTIQVHSSPDSRYQLDRCECCDIVGIDNLKAEVRFRECKAGEIIA